MCGLDFCVFEKKKLKEKKTWMFACNLNECEIKLSAWVDEFRNKKKEKCRIVIKSLFQVCAVLVFFLLLNKPIVSALVCGISFPSFFFWPFFYSLRFVNQQTQILHSHDFLSLRKRCRLNRNQNHENFIQIHCDCNCNWFACHCCNLICIPD